LGALGAGDDGGMDAKEEEEEETGEVYRVVVSEELVERVEDVLGMVGVGNLEIGKLCCIVRSVSRRRLLAGGSVEELMD